MKYQLGGGGGLVLVGGLQSQLGGTLIMSGGLVPVGSSSTVGKGSGTGWGPQC